MRRSTNIAAQGLAPALKILAKERDVQLVYRTELVGDHQTSGAAGDLTFEEALTQLLSGTGLTYRYLENNAVTIVPTVSGASSSALAAAEGDNSVVQSAVGGAGLAKAAQDTGQESVWDKLRVAQVDQGQAAGATTVSTSSSTASQGANKSPSLEEVVVTAQKRQERLQDVPVSLTVLSGDQIAKTVPQSLTDIAGYVPGLSVVSSTPGQTQIIIRGIGTDSAGLGALVGTYVDDIQVGSNSSAVRGGLYSFDLMPYDIERIEVLRGPQGTLYGAGNMGGLVKYVLVLPELTDLTGAAGVTANTIDHSGGTGWGIRAAVNIPLIADTLAIRLSGFRQDTPGYIDEVDLGLSDYNSYTQEGGRFSGLLKLSDKLSVKLDALLQDIKANGSSAIFVDRQTEQPIYGDFKTAAGAATNEQKTRLYSLTVNWDVDFAALTSVSSWQSFDNPSVLDFGPTNPGLPEALGATTLPSPQDFDLKHKFSQEVRLASPAGHRFQWMLGGYYTDEVSQNNQKLFALDASGQQVPGVNPVISFYLPWDYTEWAAFANGTVAFGERFDLAAGVRYAANRQSGDVTSYGLFIDGSLSPPSQPESIKFNEDVTTWMVSPQWHLTRNSMLYARVATGYRPGGYSFALDPVSPRTFKSDSLTNYEIGYKTTVLDSRLSLDLSAYDIEWKDVQVTLVDPVLQTQYFGNGDTARSRGAEAGAAYSAAGGLSLGATVSFTDAHLTANAPGIGGVDGARLPLSPRWQASLRADYQHKLRGDVNFQAGVGWRYADNQWTIVSSNPESSLETQPRPVDAYLGLQFTHISTRLFVRNAFTSEPGLSILNDRSPTAGPYTLARVQPRTIGVVIDAKF
jgi:outer membrane receptor protein involved in Fe transport